MLHSIFKINKKNQNIPGQKTRKINLIVSLRIIIFTRKYTVKLIHYISQHFLQEILNYFAPKNSNLLFSFHGNFFNRKLKLTL